MGKQIKGRCRRARENFPLSTGKFLKKIVRCLGGGLLMSNIQIQQNQG